MPAHVGSRPNLLQRANLRRGGQTVQQKLAVWERAQAVVSQDLIFSRGWASFPEDGGDAEDLLSLADREMYRSKQQSETRQKARVRWRQWAQKTEGLRVN